MSIFRKLLNILFIVLIAVTAAAQNSSFNPDDPNLPPLLIKWDAGCYNEWDGDQDIEALAGHATNRHNSDPPPLWSLASDFYDTFCAGGEDYNGTKGRNAGRARDACDKYFQKVKANLTHPCQYIEAYGVVVRTADAADDQDTERCERTQAYWYHNIKEGFSFPSDYYACGNGVQPPADKDSPGWEGDLIKEAIQCTDTEPSGYDRHVQFNIQFRIKWQEGDCKGYEDTQNKKCPECYENRKGATPGDLDGTNDVGSQGCVPQKSSLPWKEIEVGDGSGDLDIGKFYKYGGSGKLQMKIPTCLANPALPDTPFNTFKSDWETDLDPKLSGTQNDIEAKINAIYGTEGKAGERTNQWRGSCGRGMFFYKNPVAVTTGQTTANQKFKDSNLVSALPPKTTDNIDTSEIWESRTGCYNPEERFVHMPPYKTFKTEHDALTPLPSATDRIKFYEPSAGGRQIVSGSLREGPPDEPESGSGDSEFLVPNDRLLMEHPLCTARVFSQTLQAGLIDTSGLPQGLGQIINPYGPLDSYAYQTPNGIPLSPAVIKTMLPTEEDKKDIEAGALPMCMTLDYADDADDYCSEYLKFSDTIDLTGNQLADEAAEAERRRKGKYSAERYYFNYDTFCWEKKERPFILPPDPYERWMPLAVRAYENPTKADATGYDPTKKETHQNFLGENVEYTITDIRRPTFTPYAERHTYDFTEAGKNPYATQDNKYINLSLEEYGYGDTPHARTDYNIDPTNIYGLAQKPDANKLLLEEFRGRKYKLQQCLRMYLEQWAFEGDKGAILLSSKEAAANLGNRSNLSPDLSMCQWVAYYDTSANYSEQRNAFKELMTFFLTKGAIDGGSPDTENGSRAALVLGGKLPTVPFPGFTSIDGLLKDDNNFRRGLRPEYFDYMNFLTASMMQTEMEDNNLTNKTEVDGGEHFYNDLYNRLDPLRDPKKGFSRDPITGIVGPNIPSPLQYPQKINFSKRDCETVVPPQFWRDTINPFYEDAANEHSGDGCHPIYDFRNITNVIWTLENRNKAMAGISNNFLADGFRSIIETAIKTNSTLADNIANNNFHWLTTREDMPVISLGTAVPSLPVFGIGIAPKPNASVPTVYFTENWEKFPTAADTDIKGRPGGNPNENFEMRDVWLARSGGNASMNYSLIQDDSKFWRLDFPVSRLGAVVIDEVTRNSGREWVDHSFPARNCMHSEPLDLLKLKELWKFAIDPNTGLQVQDGTPAPDGLISDAWKTWDDIRLDKLAMYMKEVDASKPQAFKQSNILKDFGGFKVKLSKEGYYKWLPTPWSFGFGLGKNFWCEFEAPYFPYFIGNTEFEHAKKPVAGHFKINGQLGYFLEFPLEKKYKPRLEYYRVERIRDACGPFGVASTWVDDPNGYISDWLIGNTGKFKLKSRCADWFDTYRRKTNDPKIIAWRLPRFDYEFLKSFLECTGPIKTPDEVPPVCKRNDKAWDNNRDACKCEVAKFLINTGIALAYALGEGNGTAIECQNAGDGSNFTDKCDNKPNNCDCDDSGNTGDCATYCGPGCDYWRTSGGKDLDIGDKATCFAKWCDYNGARAIDQALISNTSRALDYCTRGDTEYSYNHDETNKKYSLIGFNNKTPYIGRDGKKNSHNSVDIEKFWLQTVENGVPKELSASEPFGFWCKCPADNPETTRCREDFCNCQQQALLVGRNFDFSDFTKLGGVPADMQNLVSNMQKLTQPVAVCKWYGPYLRWLQCFYQARAKACPVVTREISDSISYDSVYDPFQGNKKNNIPDVTEATQRATIFNICTPENPDGNNLNNTPYQILDYLRWSKEEPNHLARLPVWFESGGAGYKNQDFVFQSQTRRWESPFMELAVPFPIDLITRNCADPEIIGGKPTGKCKDDWKNVGVSKDDATQQGEGKNNLKEIQNRGGLGYREFDHNSNSTSINEYTDTTLDSVLLKKADNSRIRPDGATLDNSNYLYVYKRYIEGLYAAHLGFRHKAKPEEPWSPTDLAPPPLAGTLSDTQDIHPRAQDAIVGPYGCDIGGWYEMMLYQARCIKWWKLNCICDYDKTFAIGSDITYVHKKAGATFEVAIPSYYNANYKLKVGQERGLGYALLDKSERNTEGKTENPDQSELTVVTDKLGKHLVFSGASKETPTVVYRKITIPLAYRGIASPEFAESNRTTNTDYVFKGLNDVLVGDIIIWNEAIDYTLSSGEKIDAGYPRHVAYVDAVERDEDGGAISIRVSEMNWGKNIDSCGNTNRWGKVTKRTIMKPMCASNIEPADCPYKASVKQDNFVIIAAPGTVDMYASCQNADWEKCVEKYWDQVMVYRPYNFTANADKTAITSYTPDPVYSDTSCPAKTNYPRIYNKDEIILLAEQFSNLLPDNMVKSKDKQTGNMKYNPVKIKNYIEARYKQGNITKQQLENGLWKLLIDPDRGAVAVDELESTMLNALTSGGAFGRCDPPVEFRKNYKDVIKDFKIKNKIKD